MICSYRLFASSRLQTLASKCCCRTLSLFWERCWKIVNNYTPKLLFISWEQAGGKSLRFKNELEQGFSSPVDFLTKGANFRSNWGCYFCCWRFFCSVLSWRGLIDISVLSKVLSKSVMVVWILKISISSVNLLYVLCMVHTSLNLLLVTVGSKVDDIWCRAIISRINCRNCV